MIKKYILSFIFLTGTLFASEKENIKLLDEIYEKQNYDMAIEQGKKILLRYPESKKRKEIEERIAKTYYLKKNYKETIEMLQKIVEKYQLTTKERDEYYYYIGKSYLLIGDEKNSEIYLKKIPKINSYYERLVYDRGVIYLGRDEYEKAFKSFQILTKIGKELKNSAIFNMVLTAYNDENYSMAIEVLNRYVVLKDKNRDESVIAYIYGTSYYKTDDEKNAIKYLSKLAEKYDDTPYGKKAIITLIEIYANKKDFEMVRKYSEMLEGTEEEKEAFATLGDYYVSIKKYKEAKENYKKAGLENNYRAIYGYGYSFYQEGKYAEALPYFKKLEKSVYYNQAIYYKFAIYYNQRKYSQILKERGEAKKIVVTQQDNDNINILIANSAYEMKNYSLAKDYYSRLSLHTPSKDNFFRVITMSGKLKEINDVEARFEEYKRKYPKDTKYKKRIYIAAGEAFYNNQRSDLAEKAYKEYLTSEPDKDIENYLTALLINEKKYGEASKMLENQEPTMENFYLKAVAATGIGEYVVAEELYNKILNMINNDPTNELYLKVKLNRINNSFLEGKYQKTIEFGEEYLKISNSPNKEDVIEKIGLSYFRMDKMDKSREYFSKLLEIETKKIETKFQIGETYIFEKDYNGAKKIYQEAYDETTNEKQKEIALYSLAKVAGLSNKIGELNKISKRFLKEYPESEYKENMISIYSNAGEKIKSKNEIITTYKTIYENSSEEHVKQNAIEKLAQASFEKKQYNTSIKYSNQLLDKSKKSLLLAQNYEKLNKLDLASKEYLKLLNNAKYKEYGTINLAKYYNFKKDYKKSKKYYNDILKMKSTYKDLAMFQLGAINEVEQKNKEAIKNYTNIFKKYPNSSYAEEAKLKAATLNENVDLNTSAKLYNEIAKKTKNKEYKIFAYEKLIFINLKSKQTETAKKYYENLKKLDNNTAKKYEGYF